MAVHRRSIIWRLACDPICRLWSGIGDLHVPDNRLDPGGAIYTGAGALLQVPVLKQLMNGLADRVEFSVSGVTPETIRLAIEDRESVQGAFLDVGYVVFDAGWQVTDVVWDWRGQADILSIDRQSTERGGQRSISLSVASTDTDRANPRLTWWTDADQRRRYPTEAAFSHVAGINAGTSRRWGPK